MTAAPRERQYKREDGLPHVSSGRLRFQLTERPAARARMHSTQITHGMLAHTRPTSLGKARRAMCVSCGCSLIRPRRTEELRRGALEHLFATHSRRARAHVRTDPVQLRSSRTPPKYLLHVLGEEGLRLRHDVVDIALDFLVDHISAAAPSVAHLWIQLPSAFASIGGGL